MFSLFVCVSVLYLWLTANINNDFFLKVMQSMYFHLFDQISKIAKRPEIYRDLLVESSRERYSKISSFVELASCIAFHCCKSWLHSLQTLWRS